MAGCDPVRTAAEPRMDTKTEPRITLMTRIHKMPKIKLRMTKECRSRVNINLLRTLCVALYAAKPIDEGRFARFMRYPLPRPSM